MTTRGKNVNEETHKNDQHNDRKQTQPSCTKNQNSSQVAHLLPLSAQLDLLPNVLQRLCVFKLVQTHLYQHFDFGHVVKGTLECFTTSIALKSHVPGHSLKSILPQCISKKCKLTSSSEYHVCPWRLPMSTTWNPVTLWNSLRLGSAAINAWV